MTTPSQPLVLKVSECALHYSCLSNVSMATSDTPEPISSWKYTAGCPAAERTPRTPLLSSFTRAVWIALTTPGRDSYATQRALERLSPKFPTPSSRVATARPSAKHVQRPAPLASLVLSPPSAPSWECGQGPRAPAPTVSTAIRGHAECFPWLPTNKARRTPCSTHACSACSLSPLSNHCRADLPCAAHHTVCTSATRELFNATCVTRCPDGTMRNVSTGNCGEEMAAYSKSWEHPSLPFLCIQPLLLFGAAPSRTSAEHRANRCHVSQNAHNANPRDPPHSRRL